MFSEVLSQNWSGYRPVNHLHGSPGALGSTGQRRTNGTVEPRETSYVRGWLSKRDIKWDPMMHVKSPNNYSARPARCMAALGMNTIPARCLPPAVLRHGDVSKVRFDRFGRLRVVSALHRCDHGVLRKTP